MTKIEKDLSANDATSGATLVGSPTEKVSPQPGEGRQEFVERCMTAMEGEFPSQAQRFAVCNASFHKNTATAKGDTVCGQCGCREFDGAAGKMKCGHEGGRIEFLRDFSEVMATMFEKAEEPQDGECVVLKQDSEQVAFAKVEDRSESTFVLGPVLVPESIDKQGDIIAADEIEKAAHKFLREFSSIGQMHRMMLGSKAAVVESTILRSNVKVGDRKLKKGTWLLGVEVFDKAVRRAILGGQIKGFSIGGRGESEPASV